MIDNTKLIMQEVATRFKDLSDAGKRKYLKEHPDSRFAKLTQRVDRFDTSNSREPQRYHDKMAKRHKRLVRSGDPKLAGFHMQKASSHINARDAFRRAQVAYNKSRHTDAKIAYVEGHLHGKKAEQIGKQLEARGVKLPKVR